MATVRELKREKRENEILDAAQELFRRKGFSSTTMDEIAQAALVAKGTIYQHFETKEKLVKALLARGFELLTEYVQRKTGDTPPGPERLRALIKAELDFFNRQINLFEVLYSEQSVFESEIGDMVYPEYKKHMEYLEREIASGAGAGYRSEAQPRDLALALFALIRSFGLRWMMENGKGSPASEVERIFALAGRLLLADEPARRKGA